jgi:hypothetical protein
MKNVLASAIGGMFLLVRLTAGDEMPLIKDSHIEPLFEPVLMQQVFLLQRGGASVVDVAGGRFFIAVGFTEVRDNSSSDTLRQMRVGRVHAQKEAVQFLEQTKVVAEEKLIEKTVITTKDGQKKVKVLKTLDETTVATVRGSLQSLSPIGTWKSLDGKLFFYAIGKQIK